LLGSEPLRPAARDLQRRDRVKYEFGRPGLRLKRKIVEKTNGKERGRIGSRGGGKRAKGALISRDKICIHTTRFRKKEKKGELSKLGLTEERKGVQRGEHLAVSGR